MSVRKSCYTCKHYKQGLCSNGSIVICGDDMSGWKLSENAKVDLLHDAEPVVTEKNEQEIVKVKTICNNCFWWNKTCHNKKSCCYGDYKDYNGFCGWFEPAKAETNIAAPEHDAVNSPAHYTSGGIECIDCIKAALGDNFIGFLIGNVFKYCYRYRNKNGLEDLKKAAWYLDRAIKEIEDETK